MKFLRNRVLPFVCIFSLVISLCMVPVSAASGVGATDALDDESVTAWSSIIHNPVADFVGALASVIGVAADSQTVFWGFVDQVVAPQECGEIAYDDLVRICNHYNSVFNSVDGSIVEGILGEARAFMTNSLSLCLGIGEVCFEVREWGTSGYFRIVEVNNNLWVVNSKGQFPCAVAGASGPEFGGNKWVGERSCSTAQVVMQDYNTLTSLNAMIVESGISSQIRKLGNYYAIWYNYQYYCDSDGRPFVAPYDGDKWASNQTRPDTGVLDENGKLIEGLPEDNQTNIDLSGMIVTLPDGTIKLADSIIYDESTKTYYTNCSDFNNSYVTYNYSWTYHINYTSITYIGQTEEYNKYYEVYYELPDGRDSADLTKEDLEQLNVSVDVLPYTRAVDDVSLKSLYHFDGDTRDSSYWNYKTDFTWNSGASVTYMDAGVFEGALYLDEGEHDFTFTLSSFIGSEFTLQWRYYQSATAAPVTDSYLRFGSTDVLKFNGSQIMNSSGAVLSSIPVGTWNELCLTGDGETVYFYINGVMVSSWPSYGYSSKEINFHFGSEQQTFKYFDELRFLSKDLYGSGTAYTPTAVPYDTNLTLVLPDSENIIADEWVEWIPGADTTLVIDFTQGDMQDMSYIHLIEDGLNFDVTYELTEQGLVITRTDDSTGTVSSGAAGLLFELQHLLPARTCYYAIRIYCDGISPIYETWLKANLGAGSPSLDIQNYSKDYYPFSWRAASTGESYDPLVSSNSNWAVLYPNGKSVCISRIEFAYDSGGSYQSRFSTPIQHSTVSAIASDSMHVPSLAVRTDLTITDYQIGGVRPSVPTKGLVWAMVENERITSIQIYNGQAWESCDGRIWTGQRWVPASSYNIITLQDMYDIVDATPNYEYIYSESGFWAWWQKSWNAFTERLFKALESGGAGGSGGEGSDAIYDVDLDADIDIFTGEEDDQSFWQFVLLVIDGGKSVVSGTRKLFSGVVSSIPATMDEITGAFEPGGVAVGVFDGGSIDPDADELPDPEESETVSLDESEVPDPWRYR